MAWCSIYSNLIPPRLSLLPTPRTPPPPNTHTHKHTHPWCRQASTAGGGGGGNRQQGSSCQTAASHCMSAFCSSTITVTWAMMPRCHSHMVTVLCMVMSSLFWYRRARVTRERRCLVFVSNCWCQLGADLSFLPLVSVTNYSCDTSFPRKGNKETLQGRRGSESQLQGEWKKRIRTKSVEENVFRLNMMNFVRLGISQEVTCQGWVSL